MLSKPTNDGYLPFYLVSEPDNLWGQILTISIDGTKGQSSTNYSQAKNRGIRSASIRLLPVKTKT